jgi:hypothetical protein
LTSYQPLPSFWDVVSLPSSDERINVGWFGTSRVRGLLDVEEDKKRLEHTTVQKYKGVEN